MASNLISSGDAVNVTAPTGGYTTGTIVAYGSNQVGVAAETVAAGALVNLHLKGRWSTTQKTAGASDGWSAGTLLYLTPTGNITAVSAGNQVAGIATAAAATGATTGELIINRNNA